MTNSTFLFGALFALLAVQAEKPPQKKKKRRASPVPIDPQLPKATPEATPQAATIQHAPGPGEEFRNVPTVKPKTKRGATVVPKKPASQPASTETFRSKVERFIVDLKAAGHNIAAAKVRKDNFPFSFQGDSRMDPLRAQREYLDFLKGTLPPEKYPVSPWMVGEDFEVIKLGPARWVGIELGQPKTMSEVFMSWLPSWQTVAYTAGTIAIIVAPEVLAYYGIEAGVLFTAAKLATVAAKIAAVIGAAAKGTGAFVAEIAAQAYGIRVGGVGLSLGRQVANEIKKQGLKLLVRAGIQ